ncbi:MULTISPECIES: transglutaminase family protein [Streptomyces]|uniref:Transglutaminase n=1 Tax=Streptomyces venezuelae TaxID=54571 RepID=A0A5P2BBC3_STRVZ|nr:MULTISPECIES: transglutaminase family protein [Streptomyces]NEA04724.1 transglutaminase family protein [Streptomyces sp. SID10116]MYY87497.1 transglutaminase [Streptomyces sp. SID335]MYZ18872.1 transglutaminase [Streptomyces sp. SID337]NDZ84594.1 transglutaminase family protein [Streptomyces sp. SID10115]NEB48447.1 transglutaminase family protein [Streptomyces sp. SID339]
MRLTQEKPDLSVYLAADEVVDHHHPLVREVAAGLARTSADAYAYARAAFEYVRDAIPHSQDVGRNEVPWRASDVLRERTGICTAKSHALAALLRAEGIPTGFCYQRLRDDNTSGYSLHGLVAVRLDGAWHRQDPRGNIPDGVDAQFRIGEERLAWPVDPECNEVDYPVLYAEPSPVAVRALREARDRLHLWQTYPSGL